MPRIVGIDVPNNKAIAIALSYIYGIGRYAAGKILKEVGIDPNIRAGKLTEDDISRITKIA
jgi:small subunit ribosomal protein S13